ncbi:hypothetical protein ACJJTC_011246 [Scirpophaga incertulas]
MPGPNTILRRHARKMVYDVYCFMEKEAKTEKETVRRTAEATKTSERTVRRIVKEGRNSEFLTVFRTPGKKRNKTKPITEIDTFDRSVVRTCSKAWSDGSVKGLKKPISKGQRIVIVHAGSEAGFIPNALLLFKAGTKSGDFHDNMNYDNYTKWLRSQLIPNLPQMRF